MTLTIEAIYENGVLKPAKPLPLKEHEKVTVTIQPVVSRARQTAGMVPWTGSVEDLDYLIDDVDNDLLEGP
jgi:predicted DNA-binding antitoxin AbrB/MazE fold protein